MSLALVLDRVHCHVSIWCFAGLLTSCTVLDHNARRARPTTPTESASTAPVAIQQVDMGGSLKFVHCAADCASPTRKTVGEAPRVALPAATVLPHPKPAAHEHPADGEYPVSTAGVPEPLRISITFDLASAKLREDQKQRLRVLGPALRAASSIRIEGRTDAIGPRAPNDKISEARALAVMVFVRDELLLRSEHRPTLSASGKGLCCYAEDNLTERGRAANRRADVSITPSNALLASRGAVADTD